MSAQLVLLTRPTDPVVTLDEVKAHLNVFHGDDDAMLTIYLAAAVATIDPARGGWLGRALRPQTWQLRRDGFPTCGIELPYPPLISVTSFKYDDADGDEQTLVADTDYRVIGGDGLIAGKSELAPVYGGAWPTARCDHGSVRITYQAGYPVAGGEVVDAMPEQIKAWVLLVVGSLYSQRESVATTSSGGIASLPDHIMQMLFNLRLF